MPVHLVFVSLLLELELLFHKHKVLLDFFGSC